MNSHSGYYLWAAEQLVASGLAVYALDLHGRGKSDGERFYLEKIAHYVGDVDAVVTLAKSREPGLPVFLLGHSAGGVTSCVLRHRRREGQTLKLYDGHVHDVLNDYGKGKVMADITGWINARLPR